MEQLSKKIVYSLVKSKYLREDRIEEYIYSLACFLETSVSSLVLLTIGIMCDKLLPIILFLIFFSVIKKRCGGYHAKTYKSCLLCSCFISISFVILIAPIMIENMIMTFLLLIIGFLLLEILGAVNHPGMGWEKEEYRESQRITRIVVFLEVFIVITFYALQASTEMVVYMTFAIWLNGLLLLIEKIRETYIDTYRYLS